MESLPLLPGYHFPGDNPTSRDHKRISKFSFCRGFPMIHDNFNYNFSCDAKFIEYDPLLTYGKPRVTLLDRHNKFLPHYALFDGKKLCLNAYFKQGIFGSPDENVRVRVVNIVYFLEDDTLTVLEPHVTNSGYPQGKIVKRGKIPKPDGKPYHWKDLNVGIELEIYGIKYRVYDCNLFTREFLTSQGIDVNESEQVPSDPYTVNREIKRRMIYPGHVTRGPAEDSRFKYLEYDGMVLTFDAFSEDCSYFVRYFLVDDTMMISKKSRPGEKGSMLLKRTKVPKNWKDLPATYPACYLEKTDEEVREYYSPTDLKIGETVFLFGRRFFLYDCDPFTRRYYSSMLHMEQPERITPPEALADPCQLPPQPPGPNKRAERALNLIRRLYNFPKRLRYNLTMDAVHPEDENREFVLEYCLSKGVIRINERDQPNSGRLGGCFLNWVQVPKPGTGEMYSPDDFYIGNRLNIFGHWFIVSGTEPFVYKYMMSNPDKFSEKVKENIRQYLKFRGMLLEEEENGLGNEDFGSVHGEPKVTKHLSEFQDLKEIPWVDKSYC